MTTVRFVPGRDPWLKPVGVPQYTWMTVETRTSKHGFWYWSTVEKVPVDKTGHWEQA